MTDSSGRYVWGDSSFELPEQGSTVIESAPEDVADKLERSGFEHRGARFVKEQRIDNGDSQQILTVRLVNRTLHLDAGSAVGIVRLVSGKTVKINPKIGWDSVFRMLLATQDRERARELVGIPIEDLEADDVEIGHIFPLLAVNFLEGIEEIRRNGFVRELRTEYRDLEQPRGRIDLEQSLVNQARGSLEHRCLVKEIDYQNVVNAILHQGAQILLELFQGLESVPSTGPYRFIVSEVDRVVRDLERLGVSSTPRDRDAYTRFNIEELPRQRAYYRRATDHAQAIIQGSGPSTGEAREEFLVDYVLNMDSVFENFTQTVLGDALEHIQSYDYTQETADLYVDQSPSLGPFPDRPKAIHQPDHVLKRRDGTPVAVLDSKYYQEGKNPVDDGRARSRMFSYAYLTDVQDLAFLTPLHRPWSAEIKGTGAQLHVVGPGGAFDIDSFREAAHDYLHQALMRDAPLLEVFRAVHKGLLCLDDAERSDLEQVTDPKGPFSMRNEKEFSHRVITRAARHSNRVAQPAGFEQGGDWTRQRVEECIDERSPRTTTCVPVFRREGDDERLDLYFVQTDGSGNVIGLEEETDLRLY